MPLLDRFRLRLRSLFRRSRVERELEDELSFHLEQQTAESLAAGMSPEEARRAAMRALGGLPQVQEECRDMRMTTAVETSLKDLRYAFRTLRKDRSFAAASILVLALGIGANTAIFSVAYAVLLRPLPFPQPQQIVRLSENRGFPGNYSGLSYPNFRDWSAWNRSFTSMAAFTGSEPVLTGAGDPLALNGLTVSASFLDVLGVQPAIGRRFLPEEDSPGANHGADSAIIGDSLWRRRFSADSAVLGRTVTLSGRPFVIVGVLPRGFDPYLGTDDIDVLTTAAAFKRPGPGMWRPLSEERGLGFLDGAVGRLKPGISMAAAQADMDRVGRLLVANYPTDNPGEGATMLELQRAAAGDIRPMLLVLLAAAAVVLLIACANISGLALARVTRRQREISVRAAVGAGKWRIVRQLLAEGLALSALGGFLGVWLAALLTRFLAFYLQLPASRVTLDWTAFAFAAGAAVISAVTFSLAPAIHAARFDLLHGLKEAALNVSGSARQKRMQSLLVLGQIALAAVLLNACGLLAVNLIHLQRAGLGFAPQHTLTFPIMLPAPEYTQQDRARFLDALVARLQTIPGVRAAGAGGQMPFRGFIGRTVLDSVAGQPTEPKKRRSIAFSPVTPGYFQALGIPIKSGRVFTDLDTAGTAPVVILNESAARRYFGSRDPIGQQIEPELWNGAGSATQPRTIIGIVGDVKLQTASDAPVDTVYWPVSQVPAQVLFWAAIRTAGEPLSVAAAARSALGAMDRRLPFYKVEPLTASFHASMNRPRYNTTLIALFAGLALVLTAVGLYGVIAYSVAQRTHEIGIRVALGARRSQVVQSFVWRGFAMSTGGIAIGLAIAKGSVRLMRSLVFGASPDEPLTFAAAAATLILVALAASYIPARRATRIDPVRALRYE
jgi:putative ABC transport system permease protein